MISPANLITGQLKWISPFTGAIAFFSSSAFGRAISSRFWCSGGDSTGTRFANMQNVFYLHSSRLMIAGTRKTAKTLTIVSLVVLAMGMMGFGTAAILAFGSASKAGELWEALRQ